MIENRTEDSYRDLDIRELIAILWRRKVFVITTTIAAGIVSIIYATNLPDIYESSALLAPANQNISELSSMAGQYGGLASIAGITIPKSGGQIETAIAIATMKSREFFRKHLYEEVLVELMAVRSWDRGSGILVLNEDIYNRKKDEWIVNDAPRLSKPTVQEAYEVFSSILTIVENKQTGFVTISLEHVSPRVAKEWIDRIVDKLDTAIRSQAIGEAERSIEYLKNQRDRTVLVNLHNIFSGLIEEQTKTMMLAHVAQDYVFRVIDPAVVSEVKSRPSRALICQLGTFAGAFLAVLLVLGNHFLRSSTGISD